LFHSTDPTDGAYIAPTQAYRPLSWFWGGGVAAVKEREEMTEQGKDGRREGREFGIKDYVHTPQEQKNLNSVKL